METTHHQKPIPHPFSRLPGSPNLLSSVPRAPFHSTPAFRTVTSVTPFRFALSRRKEPAVGKKHIGVGSSTDRRVILLMHAMQRSRSASSRASSEPLATTSTLSKPEAPPLLMPIKRYRCPSSCSLSRPNVAQGFKWR